MSNEEMVGLLGLSLAGALVVIALFLLIYYVVLAIAEWRIFKKSGEAGWKSLVPILREHTLYKICWAPKMFWIFFALGIISSIFGEFETQGEIFTFIKWGFSLAAFVISVIQNVKLSKSFGHGNGFAVGLVLLNPIFMLILGLGSSQYIGNTTEAE